MYQATSANDFPQFHREIFQQNSENLSQGKEDIAKFEQGLQDDANFNVAKWTNECFGGSTARVPLYARGKATKYKSNILPPTKRDTVVSKALRCTRAFFGESKTVQLKVFTS